MVCKFKEKKEKLRKFSNLHLLVVHLRNSSVDLFIYIFYNTIIKTMPIKITKFQNIFVVKSLKIDQQHPFQENNHGVYLLIFY